MVELLFFCLVNQIDLEKHCVLFTVLPFFIPLIYLEPDTSKYSCLCVGRCPFVACSLIPPF